MERLVLGHQNDGSEGILCSTIPPYVKTVNKRAAEDEEEDGITMVSFKRTTDPSNEKA